MACGCSKRKKSQTADEVRSARVDRVIYAPKELNYAALDGVASTHAMSGTSFRRIQYLVLPKTAILEGDFGSAETYNVLQEARNRIKVLGPDYGIKTTRV